MQFSPRLGLAWHDRRRRMVAVWPDIRVRPERRGGFVDAIDDPLQTTRPSSAFQRSFTEFPPQAGCFAPHAPSRLRRSHRRIRAALAALLSQTDPFLRLAYS
jgi:hypothetical protein